MRRAVCGDFGGWEVAPTRDGGTIRVEVDVQGIAVVSERATGQERARVELPRPPQGIGGYELFLSREERWLALFLYSGQSEVGYEVFALEPALRRVGGLPYVHGTGDGPTFSADEARLVFATTINSGLVADEAELDDDERLLSDEVLDWAEVRVHELETGAIDRCTVRAVLPRGLPFEGDDSYWPSNLAVIDGEVCFDTGWGQRVHIPLPMPASITVAGPRSRRSPP